MNKKQISPGLVVFLLLLLFSIVLRFNSLHLPLLNDQEAAIALKSASSSTGFLSGFSGEPGLSTMLSLIFSIFGKNETTARILSALFGLTIVFVPFLFRKILGKETSFILSVLLMLDPGLIAFSRQVNGAVISISGVLFGLGFVYNKKYVPAGIAGGIALLGSPILWPGLLALGLAIWLSGFDKAKGIAEVDGNEPFFTPVPRNLLVNGLIAMAVTVLIVGTAFLTRIEGATAPLINLTAYLKGWTVSSGFPLFLLLFSFILYQPIAILLGIMEGISGNRNGDRVAAFLLRWFVLSLLLAVAYPSKGMNSIILSSVPLLALFAKFIYRTWQSLEKPDLAAYGQIVLVFLLVPFAWMNVIVLKFPIEGQDETLRLAAAAGSLVLLIMSSVLIRFGWPPKQSATGLFFGFAILICVFTFSTAWRSAGLGKNPQAELWRYNGITDEADLLVRTIGDMSEWNKVSRQGVDIAVVNYPAPSLIWALREFSEVKEDRYLPVSSNPSIVITAAEEVPALAEAYRGQDIVLNRRASWSLILPEEWIQWYAFREIPQEKQQVILWARTDLFPGAINQFPTAIIQPQ